MARARGREALNFALIALGVAVGLGTAYAAGLAPDSVKSKHIVNGQVKEADLGRGAVTAEKLACEGNGDGDQMVQAGAVCIDKYEASVWDAPTGGNELISEDEIDGACPENGQPQGAADCVDFYARSVPGVEPASRITWFQAQQALGNSGKQLPTNAEWQQAVSGTPDTGGVDDGFDDCNTDSTLAVANTGSRSACVSRFGAFDMVGNLAEWVADWDEQAAVCAVHSAGYGTDDSCFGDATPSGFPGALIRGGSFGSNGAGPFKVDARLEPSFSINQFGFRGAR